MAETTHHVLGERAAFQLANVTKTPPQYGAITPRWLVRLLDWKPLEAGTLRVNRVADEKSLEVICEPKEERSLPASFVNYEEKPREYTLNSISSVLRSRPRSPTSTAIPSTRSRNSFGSPSRRSRSVRRTS